jgi:hypothetical protein
MGCGGEGATRTRPASWREAIAEQLDATIKEVQKLVHNIESVIVSIDKMAAAE